MEDRRCSRSLSDQVPQTDNNTSLHYALRGEEERGIQRKEFVTHVHGDDPQSLNS